MVVVFQGDESPRFHRIRNKKSPKKQTQVLLVGGFNPFEKY